jgi:serine/threonine-protein kinase
LALSAGTRLGRYEILAPLGAGGMGEVYRARDTRLSREVAVKVLPDAVARDPDRLRRFEQEARSASGLNHPCILTVHDVGESEGRLFVVTELLEGESLRERLARGTLRPEEAVAIAADIAQGLGAAHEKGIVHRDIKPENLFLTRDGRVKILDFGLARVVATDPADTQAGTEAGTRPGIVLGTASYMSPEQARGQPLDARSDIFSAGIVLYEMLSGSRPFSGESAVETMNAILSETPAPLTSVAPALDRVVRRCLEKTPERRFQHARDIAFTLESLSDAMSQPVKPREMSEGRPSVAVLLFKDLGGDPANAHVGLGLADATITELASLRSIRVRPTASALRYRDRLIDPQTAGRELGVDAVLDGSFQRSGSRLRVTVQLVRTTDGRSLWGTKIDASLEDIFRMQDEVSHRIAEALEVELTPADERRLARAGRGPGSSKSYEWYLQGRFHLATDTNLPKVNAAIECFEKAIAIDPSFALGRVGLADAYTRLAFTFDPDGEWYGRAEAMCREALASDPDLPECRYLQGRLLWHPRRGFDHAGAIRELGAAVAGKPNLAEAWRWLAIVLVHIGLLDEAIDAFDAALEIDPVDGYARTHKALVRHFQGRFAEGLAGTEEAALLGATPWNSYQEVLSLLHLKRLADAAAALERAARQFPEYVLFLPLRGLLAALEGDAPRAREQIELTIRNRKDFGHFHHAQYDIACVEALLDNPEAALDWLGQAARGGFPCVPFYRIDPWLEALRGGPAFEGLLAELESGREAYVRLFEQSVGGSN